MTHQQLDKYVKERLMKALKKIGYTQNHYNDVIAKIIDLGNEFQFEHEWMQWLTLSNLHVIEHTCLVQEAFNLLQILRNPGPWLFRELSYNTKTKIWTLTERPTLSLKSRLLGRIKDDICPWCLKKPPSIR